MKLFKKYSFVFILWLHSFSFYAAISNNSHIKNNHEFIHPGILHTERDFARMRNSIVKKEYPGYASFKLLKESSTAQSTYKMRGPYEYLSSQKEYGNTNANISRDFNAAFQNALMWKLTGNMAHAEKAKEIMLAYADRLMDIPDVQDAALLTGIALQVAYVGEILKYTYEPFTETDTEKLRSLLTNVFIPAMDKYFYNRTAYTNGNWGAHITKGYIASAIFLDDKEMYNKAKDFYVNGNDNGTISNYIDGETGQCQESGRDQAHPMFGIGSMATTCEIAFKQGDDLYGVLDNRLLKGYEYIAKYNLGYDDLPFKQWTDITGKYGKWTVISDKDRGQFDAIFEIVYNHYVVRKGFSMPYTEEVLRLIRPEGGRDGSAAHPSFGSLLFYEGVALIDDRDIGLIDDIFTNSLNEWSTPTNGASVSNTNGQMLVDMTITSTGKYRGDIVKKNVTLHVGNYPILAIKVQRPSNCLFTLDTDKGHYGRVGGMWTGFLDDVYYYDLTAKPFGANTDSYFYPPSDDEWTTSRLQFKFADITTGETSYTVDWIKTFKNLSDMTAYVYSDQSGVENNNSNNFLYYVNDGYLYVKNLGLKDLLSVYDAYGRSIAIIYPNHNNTSIPLYNRGLYFIKYQNGDKYNTVKFLF